MATNRQTETTLDKERMLTLADSIEASEYKRNCDWGPLDEDGDEPDPCGLNVPAFDMSDFFHKHCGAPTNIAARAATMFTREYDDLGESWSEYLGDYWYAAELAETALGLSEKQATDLFAVNEDSADPQADEGEPGFISPKRAAAVLRHLAETGEVDWTIQE